MFSPLERVFIIPYNWGYTGIFCFTFTGFNTSHIPMDENELSQALAVAGASVKAFYEVYIDKFAFTEPNIKLNVQGVLIVEIGVMNLDEYTERIESCKTNG